jgi:hypothetical protein
VVIRSLTLPLSGRGLNAEPRLTRVRGVPVASEALGVTEIVRRQRGSKVASRGLQCCLSSQ